MSWAASAYVRPINDVIHEILKRDHITLTDAQGNALRTKVVAWLEHNSWTDCGHDHKWLEDTIESVRK